MTPLVFSLIAFVASIVAGVFGSLLGLGGGIIVIPTLTLLLGVDIRYAIGASIVSVIATSSGAAASYVRERITNLRLAMFLELATTIGALAGAVAAGEIAGRWLFVIFGIVLAYTAFAMLRRAEDREPHEVPSDAIADRLRLHGVYFDRAIQREVRYRVGQTPLGLCISFVAGVVSGLLGVGGGVLKVPALNLAMGVPLKAATATSNFMIGVTAATGAGVYFFRGDIDPFVAGPVAGGVLIGATAGARLLGRLQARSIRIVFVIVLLYVAIQMLLKGLQ